MKIFFALLLCFSGSYALAAEEVDCTQQPIFCRILELQPAAEKEWAMDLSNAIFRHTRNTPIDPMLIVALLFQESSLRPTHSFYWGSNHADFGVAQINSKTAVRYGCDLADLAAFDNNEAIRCQVKILKSKIATCETMGRAPSWACYHSFTPELLEAYAKKVTNHMIAVTN